MTKPAIPGFEIIGTLGEGGMGTVYLARQISLNRMVAVKVLPEALTDDPVYVMRFRQEAKAAAQLNHNNLVQIYDAGIEDGVFYFVMEYVDGESAGRRVHRKGRLEEETTLLIGESVAAALEYAWNNARLVHRDIKPDNILIDGDGTVKIADLGLAKIVGAGAGGITITKMMIGTPYYCSPEQARGESHIDYHADIYALGATMYHMVTGYVPFNEDSGVAAIMRNVTDFLPDPRERNPGLSENLGWLLEIMMAKQPSDRQADWAGVLADIDRVLHGARPLTPPPPEGRSTVARGARRLAPKPRPAPMPARPAKRLLRFFLAVASVCAVILLIIWLKMELMHDAQPSIPPDADLLLP